MQITSILTHLGWGLLSQFPLFRCFPNLSALWIHTLAIEYHVYIWQVSPQLSCGDTCQIWMWFKYSNRYFGEIENFAYREINKRSFSEPHPWCWGLKIPVEQGQYNGCCCPDSLHCQVISSHDFAYKGQISPYSVFHSLSMPSQCWEIWENANNRCFHISSKQLSI